MHKCTSGIEEGISHDFIPGTLHSANNTEYQLARRWRVMPSNASDTLADVAVVPPSYIIILIKTKIARSGVVCYVEMYKRIWYDPARPWSRQNCSILVSPEIIDGFLLFLLCYKILYIFQCAHVIVAPNVPLSCRCCCSSHFHTNS
jgi:hypothetical protein